jgi:cysteine-rich repeat protein
VKPDLPVRLAGLLAAVVAVACTPHPANDRYACDPLDPASCPAGQACLALGPAHRCYSDWSHDCGNGVIEPEEQCDGESFGGGDATAFGCGAEDTLFCLDRVCRVYCTRCGNGRLELTPSGGGEQCDDGNREDGDGCSRHCRLETCGNGVVDPGEDCDDGGLVPGDGCSPACRREECGNGIIDYETGEHCDDGNRLSQDGCASDCTVEFPTWTRWTSPFERPRDLHGMAHDAARDRVVLFGGRQGDAALDELWEHDGERWLRRRFDDGPEPRMLPGVVYDPEGRRVLIQGGMRMDGSAFGDLWAWDGEVFTRLPTAGGPGPSVGAASAWDAPRQRLVLFGGAASYSGRPVSETWILAGEAWTELHPPESPPARATGCLVHDPMRDRLVLFGGFDSDGVLADTWALVDDAWTPVPSAEQPPARHLHSLTWHEALGAPVLFGGFDAGTTVFADTWILGDGGWSRVSVDTAPPARAGHAATWHDTAGHVLIQGGSGGSDYADTWSFAGTGWRVVTPRFAPPSRFHAAAAHDPARGHLVLFGGADDQGRRDDTWLHDGETWSEVLPGASGPSPRSLAALVYDEARGQVLLFGGLGTEGALDDAWAFDGRTWTALAIPDPPPARGGHVLVYDPGRDRVILHGGFDGGARFLSDTWELDPGAGSWVPVTTAVFPSARYRASAAWDASRQAVVLFGGYLPSEVLDDTWFLIDGAWEPLVSDRKPRARAGALLAHDASRGRVLLFGGAGYDGIPGEHALGDTWELREDGWHRLETVDAPGPRDGMAWAYDARRRRIALIGGIPGQDELWTLRYQGFGAVEVCGNGLDDDADSLVDCDDPDCGWEPTCGVTP